MIFQISIAISPLFTYNLRTKGFERDVDMTMYDHALTQSGFMLPILRISIIGTDFYPCYLEFYANAEISEPILDVDMQVEDK